MPAAPMGIAPVFGHIPPGFSVALDELGEQRWMDLKIPEGADELTERLLIDQHGATRVIGVEECVHGFVELFFGR